MRVGRACEDVCDKPERSDGHPKSVGVIAFALVLVWFFGCFFWVVFCFYFSQLGVVIGEIIHTIGRRCDGEGHVADVGLSCCWRYLEVQDPRRTWQRSNDRFWQ